jgi:hypothetical protein
MKWVARIVLLVLLAAAAFWSWRHFFPSAEAAVRRQLQEDARVVSFSQGESLIGKGLAINSLMDDCTDDIEISVDIQGFQRQTVTGKEELRPAATIVRGHLSSLKVEFLDMNVDVAPNKQTAVINLTAKIRVPGEQEFFPQELKVTMKKIDGKWLIRKIETVKTLSLNHCPEQHVS